MKKSIFLLSGIGIGAGVLYALGRGTNKAAPDKGESENGQDRSASTSSNGKEVQGKTAAGASSLDRQLTKNGQSRHGRSSMGQVGVDDQSEPEIDDRGTDQHEAAEILKTVRDGAFDASDEKLALALGRPAEEIEAWTSGSGEVAGDIDGDVVMKARTLALKRGVEI